MEHGAFSNLSRRAALTLLGSSLVVSAPTAAAPDLRAVIDAGSAASASILSVLRQRFPSAKIGGLPSVYPNRTHGTVFLAVGPASLRALLDARVTDQIIAVFTSRLTFDATMKSIGRYTGVRVSAIYAEASPDAQLELIALIYQRRITVGVLLSEETAHFSASIRAAADKQGMGLLQHRLESSQNVIRELGKLGEASALLALPDPQIFSSDNLRGLLEGAYRQGQAVVGFTPAMVNAGCLATAYSTVDDVFDQLPAVLQEVEQGKITESRYPAYWRVSINESVARSLNLVITDQAKALGRRRGRT